jgi:hypothetical protein
MMSEATNCRDVKAKARELDPGCDDDARVQQRSHMRENMDAVTGAQPADIRGQLGRTSAVESSGTRTFASGK